MKIPLGSNHMRSSKMSSGGHLACPLASENSRCDTCKTFSIKGRHSLSTQVYFINALPLMTTWILMIMKYVIAQSGWQVEVCTPPWGDGSTLLPSSVPVDLPWLLQPLLAECLAHLQLWNGHVPAKAPTCNQGSTWGEGHAKGTTLLCSCCHVTSRKCSAVCQLCTQPWTLCVI
jgi:hypothetical protein